MLHVELTQLLYLPTWPFTRSSPGVGGWRLACRVSGVDGLDDSRSVLSRPRSSSRGPRTVNDPYTPSPCCETNGPPRLYFSHWRPLTTAREARGARRESVFYESTRLEALLSWRWYTVAAFVSSVVLQLEGRRVLPSTERLPASWRVPTAMSICERDARDQRQSPRGRELYSRETSQRSTRPGSCSLEIAAVIDLASLAMRERRVEGHSTA